MRKLFLLITHNYVFFCFITLFLFSFFLIIKGNVYQNSKFYFWTNEKVNYIQERTSTIKYFFSLRKINETLIEKNKQLLSLSDMALYKNFTHEKKIIDSLYNQQYKFFSSKVINNSFINRNNYITLNTGEIHGVSLGMGVFTDKGIVGIIKSTSNRYAIALSILHSKIEISAKLLKGNNLGTLTWPGKSPYICKLSYIPMHIEVNIGDTIVTSGYSSIFPEGILVGVIEDVNIPKESNNYDLDIKLTQDPTNISYVYVVENLFSKEQLDLENHER